MRNFRMVGPFREQSVNEYETRSEHITPALKAAGWGVVEGSKIEYELQVTGGRIMGAGKPKGPKLIADYVLVFKNQKLAVVEAKAWDEELTAGVAQAKNYAGKLAVRFAYASNGQGVYPIDMETAAEGPGGALVFPSPEELWGRTFAVENAWRDRFAAIPFPDKSRTWSMRFYQEIAVNRVLEAIADGKDRALLTLATGTGKTSIAFQIAWKLFAARWNLIDWKKDGEPARRPRILFLADRNTLANQAFSDFTSFAAFQEDDLVRIAPDAIRKKGKVPKNGQVFFTIFQTFMCGPARRGADGKMHPTPYYGEYEPDFFDLIIIDECHRGGANDESSWRDILNYFKPAMQLGLTATPKRKDNVDTYKYFGDPLYIYSLKDGINDGFLTPFRVKQYSTTLDTYTHTSDNQVVEGDLKVGETFDEGDFNNVIIIEEREEARAVVHGSDRPEREDDCFLCEPEACAAGTRSDQSVEDRGRPELLPPCDRERRRTWRAVAAGVSGQREDDSDDPDDKSKTVDRRRRAERAEHRADAAGELDDRVQADHRPRHPVVRREGLFHDPRLREGVGAVQRPGMGWRADRAGTVRELWSIPL
jgi:type I restriction enzyme R subunit